MINLQPKCTYQARPAPDSERHGICVVRHLDAVGALDTIFDVRLRDFLILGHSRFRNLDLTQICLCFPVADDFSESHQAIISTLTAGLERLSASFPWIAGQVVNEGASEGNSGVFKIRRLDAESTHRLVVKDLRHVTHDSSISTMDALRRASFPMGMLTESIVAPRTTLPSDSDPDSGVTPVFLVQATFIPGGLLLTFLGHHNAMDVMGQGQVIRLLSKACRGEQFTSEELASGNLPRHDLIPLLDDYTPGPELAHQIVDRTPSASDAPPPPPPPKCTWGYFSFPATALADLKSLATDATTLPAAGYISTDDALTALIWHLDARRYLGIPQTYLGLALNMAYYTYTLDTLADAPLAGITAHLRAGVHPATSDVGHRTRALATFLSRTPDKNAANPVAGLDVSRDIMLSSWAKVDCYGLDFGLGVGGPEAVRRPWFGPVDALEGLVYLIPKAPDGEIGVAICLREEDMERLRTDEVFVKYGRYIG
ncbi:hypothetical protein BJ138DRAFT_1137512 [Hygrophoropsis aurantiaca]|uniref:Uncharacterized protein n=1 Tax=Hygrophoropsis aurantiaca TaxID=72124 RepID=A0ACB8A2U7_9AGAM|nr:hypothetical protein BJ138DRAFT_1137512 [Hygrophoropsis aurantiaca]